MKRRGFLGGLFGAALAGSVLKTAPVQARETLVPEQRSDCSCRLTHRESYSSKRFTDARIISVECAEHGKKRL